jgi:hypothetical protein
MEQNVIDVKPISSLSDFSYFIPSYQRGYRWTARQVEDLLNDIADFKPREIPDTTGKTWYCLQPLVLKKLTATEINEYNLENSQKWYEVIDGQQRLTTIFLIGHFINEMYRGKLKDKELTISYETRGNSSGFLNQLSIPEDDNIKIDKSNIDFYHISSAYNIINLWVKGNKNPNFKHDNFIDKFLNDTKVIWYESVEKDSITIFTRLNMGKIPLTNAELIKALFLNSSNFIGADFEKVRLKQLEIATEWDRIEYALHDPEFWYFINEKENKLTTRIEFIFDLMSGKTSTDDEFFTFRYFSNKFKNNSNDEITNNWNEIKQYFQTIEEWFEDREYYHKIGFLITLGIKILDIYSLSKKVSTKTDFINEINLKIRAEVDFNIDEIDYSDKVKVRKILLLHNVQTMLNNVHENTRFAFYRFKVESWDVEHIHSVQEKMPSDERHQRDWLIEASKFIKNDSSLLERINNFKSEDFEFISKDILNHFSENQKHDDDINDISNLTLLDAKTNRSYGNAVFPVKRKTIIERDSEGTFIPLCTKNVFMKFYNSDVEQMTFWGEADRVAYVNHIKQTLSPYNKRFCI